VSDAVVVVVDVAVGLVVFVVRFMVAGFAKVIVY
jgi:hypothetical protein